MWSFSRFISTKSDAKQSFLKFSSLLNSIQQYHLCQTFPEYAYRKLCKKRYSDIGRELHTIPHPSCRTHKIRVVLLPSFSILNVYTRLFAYVSEIERTTQCYKEDFHMIWYGRERFSLRVFSAWDGKWGGSKPKTYNTQW